MAQVLDIRYSQINKTVATTTYVFDTKGVRDCELAFYIDECAVSKGGCCQNTATGYKC